MTRKDYVLIADAFDYALATTVKVTKGQPTQRADQIAGLLAGAHVLRKRLKHENPQFNADLFAAAATNGPLYRAAKQADREEQQA